jgi:hypothetical protein
LAACGGDYLCSALSINSVEVVFAAGPHAWQSGEVIDLLDIIKRRLQRLRIKHRTSDILHLCCVVSRRTKIENAYAITVREQGRYQMLPDKATAACNERFSHGDSPKSLH